MRPRMRTSRSRRRGRIMLQQYGNFAAKRSRGMAQGKILVEPNTQGSRLAHPSEVVVGGLTAKGQTFARGTFEQAEASPSLLPQGTSSILRRRSQASGVSLNLSALSGQHLARNRKSSPSRSGSSLGSELHGFGRTAGFRNRSRSKGLPAALAAFPAQLDRQRWVQNR